MDYIGVYSTALNRQRHYDNQQRRKQRDNSSSAQLGWRLAPPRHTRHDAERLTAAVRRSRPTKTRAGHLSIRLQRTRYYIAILRLLTFCA